IHRDLKPANLFLTRRPDGAPCLKVLDFGISKAADQGDGDTQLTGAGELLGSPHYMSPEQVAAPRTVDERTDVWALGILLYRLISGRVPFEGEQIAVVFAKLHRDPPPPLSGVPVALTRVIEKCLEKDRDRRFATVTDLRLALLPFVGMAEDAPTVARSREVELEPMPEWDDQTKTKVAAKPAGSGAFSPRPMASAPPSAHTPAPSGVAPLPHPHPGPPGQAHSPRMMLATPPMSYPPPPMSPRASYPAMPPPQQQQQAQASPRPSLPGVAPHPSLHPAAAPPTPPKSGFGTIGAIALVLATLGIALLAFAWRQGMRSDDGPPAASTSARPR
ncbi:MAG: serine/threonine protein kinase, partial [Myxococcales bacterium]|nr:serine/threonine protein kinase [Myxococcales bacterium]